MKNLTEATAQRINGIISMYEKARKTTFTFSSEYIARNGERVLTFTSTGLFKLDIRLRNDAVTHHEDYIH